MICSEGRCNLIREGGYIVELYLGRLSADLSRVEDRLRITDSDRTGFHGDAWVAQQVDAG